MELNVISEAYSIANTKWKEYVQAEKKDPKNKLWTDLKKMYWELKHDKVLIDVFPVIQKGGRHTSSAGSASQGWPKLAIARHDAFNGFVGCQFSKDGTLRYYSEANGWHDRQSDVSLPAIFPDVVTDRPVRSRAPLPIIPPNIITKDKLTEDHYILWEVDKWEPVAPSDPYLLRRITKRVFSIEGQWDLTEVERMAMSAYIK